MPQGYILGTKLFFMHVNHLAVLFSSTTPSRRRYAAMKFNRIIVPAQLSDCSRRLKSKRQRLLVHGRVSCSGCRPAVVRSQHFFPSQRSRKSNTTTDLFTLKTVTWAPQYVFNSCVLLFVSERVCWIFLNLLWCVCVCIVWIVSCSNSHHCVHTWTHWF